MKAAEFRSALAAWESMGPTLSRILKAATEGAALLDGLEEQKATLERNINGLTERQQRSEIAAKEARGKAEQAAQDAEASIRTAASKAGQQQEMLAALEQGVKKLQGEIRQAEQRLGEWNRAIADAEQRHRKEQERVERLYKAIEQAGR